MKRLLYIFAAASLFAFTGCSNEKDLDIDINGGKGLEFVHFESASDAWLVTEDDESYTYEVVVGCTQAYESDATYNITIGENTTGVEGTDFKIPSKSFTIAAGKYVGSIPVEILYDTVGEGFTLELILDVDEDIINPAYGNTAVISVKSDKVTIDWKWLEGTWTVQDYCYYDGANQGGPYSAAIVKVDETNCIVRNIWGSGADLNATVDFTARTITIPGYQFAFEDSDLSANLYFVAVDPEAEYDIYDDINAPVTGTMTPAGVVFDNYDFLLVGGSYDGYTYAGGLRSTFTR